MGLNDSFIKDNFIFYKIIILFLINNKYLIMRNLRITLINVNKIKNNHNIIILSLTKLSLLNL